MSASERNDNLVCSESDDEEDEGVKVTTPMMAVVASPLLTMRLPPATSAPAATSSNPAQPGLPLAVMILSSPRTLLVVDDAATLVPAMFATYKGEGGERVRALYHSMLTEHKTNIDNAYTTQGNIKSALFVAFVELCCVFVAEPTEEVCDIIVDTTTAFMSSVRALFRSEMARDMTKFESSTRISVAEQLLVAKQLFPETYNTLTLMHGKELDFLAMPAAIFEDNEMNIFVIMHEFAKAREAAFYTYAKFVQTQVVAAVKERSLYIAHVFLRYFIYTLVAVCRLAAFDFAKTREAFKDPDDTVVNYYKYKIESRLHRNFGDLCSHLLVKQLSFESHIQVEYQRYAAAIAPPKPAPPPQPPVERFRPQIAIPAEDPSQQGGSCLML